MDLVVGLADVGRDDVALVGGKAAGLGELIAAGLPVPAGFVVTTEAFRVGAGPDGLTEDVRAAVGEAYAALGRPLVAVRSSATAEDLAEASFAGQQDTFLAVRGEDAVLDAVRRCWASLPGDRAVAYRREHGVDEAGVAMAVVVQELVDADAAGVLFTANPANGRRHEAVVAAAWGLGEAVVGGLVDTDEVVVRLPEGSVVSRRTADKTVMTVLADEGGTVERDVPAERRGVPVLDDAEAVALARLGARAAEHAGAPQDLEWARRDGALVLLQSRAITALPPPEADPPTDWSVPDRAALYVRASIVEQLPDPLTPLFADLVRTSVTRSLQALFAELLGEGVVRADDVDLPTVNGYAYYRYGLPGMGRLLLRSGKAFRMLLTPGRGGTEARFREVEHPRYLETVREAQGQETDGRPSAALVDEVRCLLDAGTAYYTAVQTVIPLAAASETLLTWFYDRLVRRPGDPAASTFLLGFDSLPIRAEKSLWDLATWAREQDPELGSAQWRRRFAAHLAAYGHLVYDLDFAHPVPADEPGPLLDTVRFFLRGEGSDPYARQAGLAARRERVTAEALDRVGPVRGWVFGRLLAWAQSAAPLREDALGDVGLAWPELRRLLHELGRRLLDDPEDVFWLRESELDALAAGHDVPDLGAAIEERRELWRGRRRVVPPQVLPADGLLARLMGGMLPAVTADQSGDVLTGIGASAGRVTARARVLAGPAEELQPGEVLVSAITTPAWTTLFPRAAAVVTDIGGPLSHSSIVAREYGVPAAFIILQSRHFHQA